MVPSDPVGARTFGIIGDAPVIVVTDGAPVRGRLARVDRELPSGSAALLVAAGGRKARIHGQVPVKEEVVFLDGVS